jgi:selenium metabolism protein YedF
MKTIDARGQACPMPLILTKKALADTPPGSLVQVLIDNDVSRQNVERFCIDNGMHPECSEENGVHTLRITKIAAPLSHPDAQSYCTTAGPKPHVIAFSGNTMGRGSDELGEILIKAFVNIIKETTPLPSHCLFYNSGILLAVEGSTLVESLRDLEKRGVAMLVCGTCVDYFKKLDLLRVGTISNMYTILETMTAAGHVLTP